jgi:Phage Tail Collar Domain
MNTASRMLRRTVITIGITGLLLAADAGRGHASCGVQPFIGQICTFAFDYCPKGFLPADGQLLPIQGNQPLFAILGTTYGGNGTSNFALPDLRARTVVGAVPASGELGQTAGDGAAVGLRLDNVSGGVAVPATQSPFTGLTRCVAVVGSFPVRPQQDAR